MSRRIQPVTLHILDKDYILSCPEEERSNLLAAADYLTRKMRQVKDSGKVTGTERLAVMTALHIVHESLRSKQGQDAAQGSAPGSAEIARLEQKIAAALQAPTTLA